jgi:hypothetical protein
MVTDIATPARISTGGRRPDGRDTPPEASHAGTLRGAVSRRDQIRMCDEEVFAFLAEERPLVGACTS